MCFKMSKVVNMACQDSYGPALACITRLLAHLVPEPESQGPGRKHAPSTHSTDQAWAHVGSSMCNRCHTPPEPADLGNTLLSYFSS